MWSVFFLFLSYLDGDFAKGQLPALDAEKDQSAVSNFLLSASPCAETAACHVELSRPKAHGVEGKRVGQDAEDATSDTHALLRSKRGFTYPGTLWCGAGNIADNYHQLGEFAETDKCCRIHDHCPDVIHAFSSKYGFTNFKWHSISHCDCDDALRHCLRAVNDTSSRVVGQAFFNVIESPCFEISSEEQCVERHWYGVCKRYGKVPVAVIRESVPYDFGGIEVIDVLTVAPPKIKSSEVDDGKQEETQRSESTAQSSTSGSENPPLEEPSLTNVVTAAEDFIKVLATVSTSQSSSADGGSTGETQDSDKKRKKNAGKKRKAQKKRRGMGKGKKRKQNAGRVPKVNDSVTVAPSNDSAEDVNKKMYVGDSGNLDWVSKNNDFMNSQFRSVGDSKHSNMMMRDEHQRTPGQSRVATDTAPDAKQRAKNFEEQKQIRDMDFVQLSSTVPSWITSKQPTAKPRQREAKKRQRHPKPTFLPVKGTPHNMTADNIAASTNESTSLAGLTTYTPVGLPGEAALHNVESQHEKESAFNATAQNRPIVGDKRLRLRQNGGRRKSRKLYSPSSRLAALTTEEPNNLTVGTFPKSQGVSQRLQSNSPKNMTQKSSTVVSGKTRLQILKRTGVKKRVRQSKDAIRAEQEDLSIMTTDTSLSSAVTDVDNQAKDAEASTGQLFTSRRQTITSTSKPLKTRTSKTRGSKERNGKIKIKNKKQGGKNT